MWNDEKNRIRTESCPRRYHGTRMFATIWSRRCAPFMRYTASGGMRLLTDSGILPDFTSASNPVTPKNPLNVPPPVVDQAPHPRANCTHPRTDKPAAGLLHVEPRIRVVRGRVVRRAPVVDYHT